MRCLSATERRILYVHQQQGANVEPKRHPSIAHAPTPLYRLDRLSDRWGGDIWIKRDDLTGSGMTGNKVRKLEYLIAEAEALGADTLITCGGVQSNHCRATALVAARFGYKCILLLRGDRPAEIDGNLLLDRLAGAEVRFATESDYFTHLPELLAEVADDVKRRGGKPYLIAEGGSDPVGAWGYVEALREVKCQCDAEGIKPCRIVHATGSGGTHAGLYVGTRLEGWDVEIVSAAICYDRFVTARRIAVIVEGMIELHNLQLAFNPEQLSVLDGYIGEGYARAGSEVFDLIQEMASVEGILCDPVYTGKAALCVREETRAGRFDGMTLFWHTGGVFGLFPFRKGLEQAIGW